MSTHPLDEEAGAVTGGTGGEQGPSRAPDEHPPGGAPAEHGPGGAPDEQRPAKPGNRIGALRSGTQPPSAAERAQRHRNASARAAQRRDADAVIAVVWDPELRRPSSFCWRRRTFRVERVVRTWVLTSGWWSEETEVSRHYWRVRAEGRLFDLSFDRIAKLWRLEHVLN
jgi:hypothetical protein